MPRKSWIANPNPPYNLIPAEEYVRPSKASFHIMPDMPDFVSPIDGKVVKGRRGYRNHCKEHNVTNVSDFKDTWKKGRPDNKKAERRERLEAIRNSYEQYERKR